MSDSTSYRGPQFSTLLTLLFIGLKLGGVIQWSWWWVISPMIIDFGVTILAVVILAILNANQQKKDRALFEQLRRERENATNT